MVELEEIVYVNVDGEVIAELLVDDQVAENDDVDDPDYINPLPSTSRIVKVAKSTKRSLTKQIQCISNLYLVEGPTLQSGTSL